MKGKIPFPEALTEVGAFHIQNKEELTVRKNNAPLRTVDGATLMSQPLHLPNFVVDTLLAQGLHILAGSPKVGKSWLALWLAVTVAKGEPVWNMTTRQGTTLYLCLEDSVLRIQNRLFEITEDAPSSVHFCTECTLIGQGLEEQVETFLTAHPDTVLVIIDTLQMVRPVHDATYANDYRDLSVLKRLADKHGIAILLIHHLRKEKAEDVFHRISGTTAISGAVDSSFTLVEEKRGSGRARLTCVGRDIEYRELELRRGEENVWELVSDSREAVSYTHLLMIEQRSGDSFICGFRLAWEMANELNHYEANRHPLSAEEAETDACSDVYKRQG